MARSASALVAGFLLLLTLLTLDAAQGQQPFPPTDPSDADALHAVFRQWRLEGEAAAEDPCMKRVWSGSFEINASIDCNCPAISRCQITGLNVTGYKNITEIPLALFNLTELVSMHFNNNNLSGSFPHESSLLRNLKSLWIFDNNVEGLIPEFIQNFTSLTDLYA
ncbi:unnamed protein product [Miscanthus lutarioriparius]|uniref:Uncharacterized protein n=1 Tax=Miscanthus lutarioriparius TaxID=422564 RepID=A0A811Q482_9POAL|nr:unnamed protein product [Miscanthus lutarioriparius]